MAIQMSNFDNFDINKIKGYSKKSVSRAVHLFFVGLYCCLSSKFVCNFYYKKMSILGSLDKTENVKKQFFWTPNKKSEDEVVASDER